MGTVSKTTPTIALEYCTKELKVDNKVKVKTQIWDTGNKYI